MDKIKMQASNIDEQGNVLYLDEERLKRKEVPFPPYKNRPNGLGIVNWIAGPCPGSCTGCLCAFPCG